MQPDPHDPGAISPPRPPVPAPNPNRGRPSMAAYSSVKSGSWSDPTVCGNAAGSGLFPGNGGNAGGDTVTVAHAVTLDLSVAVGNSPASGIVLQITGNTLTLAAGVTLTARGSIS